MGKPTSTKLSNSEHSILHSKDKMSIPMRSTKITMARRKSHSKTRNNIKKLFAQLRNESGSSVDNSQRGTIVVLDDSIPSPIVKKRKVTTTNSDKLKLRKTNSEGNFIVIGDDDDLIINNQHCKEFGTPTKKLNYAPVQSSTPIADNKNTLKELNISRVSSRVINNLENPHVSEKVNDVTKEINKDSYLTIDLTADSELNRSVSKTQNNTVIDLVNTSDNPECSGISVSNTSLSISGESDVTVLNNYRNKKSSNKRIHQFANGISKLNASDKGRLLELITEKIFSGCNVPSSVKSNLYNGGQGSVTRATETVEDTYIKEVILGQSTSRNSIGSNIYNPGRNIKQKSGLRMIVIDGSNVAMEHGRGKMFSVKGLKICIEYFLKRGHVVKAFVPRFRCKFGKSSDPRALDDLERRGLVVYTPSREIQGRLVAAYDDRYIVQCAAEFDGVIVSGDNYRDLLQENPRWRFIIENRLLQFTWVNDMIMFPKDPLGRNGPTLEYFLKYPQENIQQKKT